MTTVKSQLDQYITLFEDLSETLGRIEDRLEKTPVCGSVEGVSDLSNETNDLRTALIALRQSLDNSLSTDLGQFLSALKYLQISGIPELLTQVKDLSLSVSAISNQIPSLEKSVANLEALKKDAEEAGKFARHFHEPMCEILGRSSDGTYQEGKFMLRNAAQVLFNLTGRDGSGVPKDKTPDRLKVVLDHYLTKTYHDPDGMKHPLWGIFFESFWQTLKSETWNRVFKAIFLLLVYKFILSPTLDVTKSIKDLVSLQSEIQQTVHQNSQAPQKTSKP